MNQRTPAKGRRNGDPKRKPPAAATPSAKPAKPPTPDDVAVKPEHPGNIPAGTPANPVEWGEAYEVTDDDASEGETLEEQGGDSGRPDGPMKQTR